MTFLRSGPLASGVPSTTKFRQYVLRVVSNGHHVVRLTSGKDKLGLLLVSLEARQVPIEYAPSFEGGPRLDRIIATAGKDGMHIFPVKVDR